MVALGQLVIAATKLLGILSPGGEGLVNRNPRMLGLSEIQLR